MLLKHIVFDTCDHWHRHLTSIISTRCNSSSVLPNWPVCPLSIVKCQLFISGTIRCRFWIEVSRGQINGKFASPDWPGFLVNCNLQWRFWIRAICLISRIIYEIKSIFIISDLNLARDSVGGFVLDWSHLAKF